MLNYLTTTAGTGDLLAMLLPMGLMFVIMYFMLIRPENKRKKEAEEMRSNVRTGDVIVTIGGITGTVVDVKEKKFVIETGADRVRIEFTKWAISTVGAQTSDGTEKKK